MAISFSFIKEGPAVYNSYYLNGTLGSINCGDILDASCFTPALFTCRAVFRANKLATLHTIFGKHLTTGNQRSFLFQRMTTGKFQLTISGNGSTIPFSLETVDSTFDSLLWQDINLVVNDAAGAGLSKFILYVNGAVAPLQVLAGTIPANITIFNSTANLYVGSYQTGATAIPNGYFNQFGFTSDAITPNEIAALYSNGRIKRLENVCDNIVLNCYGGTWDGTKYVIPDTAGNTVTSVSLLQYSLNEQVSPYVTSVDVWIHAGQSQARGAELMANLQAGRVGISDSFYVYSASAVNYGRISSTANNNQFGEPGSQFGIEFECTDLRKADKLSKAIQWLKYAVGGTSLATVAQGGTANNWNTTGVGNLFDNLKSYITTTISFNSDRGLTTNFKGIVWMQGEADANQEASSINYLSNLNAFQSALETHIGNSLYWYICRMNPTYVRPYTTEVRQADADFIALDPSKRRLINMDDAGLMADTIHLSASGNVTVGQRVVGAIVADN